MTKTLRIAMLVDFMATTFGSTDEEYAEIEGTLTELYPDVDLVFAREMQMQLLDKDEWDVFVFDWGGLLPGAEDLTRSIYRHVLGLVRKHEANRLFIMWSSHTERYFKEAAEEEFPEFVAPNVIFWQDDRLSKRCRLFFGLPETPPVEKPYYKHGPPPDSYELIEPPTRPPMDIIREREGSKLPGRPGRSPGSSVFCQIDEALVAIIRERAGTRTIVDCGAGQGKLREMMPRDNVVSIDIMEQSNTAVWVQDARQFPYDANTMPVFIRPCHSSWVEASLEHAVIGGATSALYVSEPKNLTADLGWFATRGKAKRVGDWVGADGEQVFEVVF